MLGEYVYGAVGGHIEKAYLNKDKVILTHGKGEKPCGGEERRQEREIKRELITPAELSLSYEVTLHSPEHSVLFS